MKSRGPKHDPCGTPQLTSPRSESLSFTLQHCFLLERYDRNQRNSLPATPLICSLFIRILWFTVSKAFFTSPTLHGAFSSHGSPLHPHSALQTFITEFVETAQQGGESRIELHSVMGCAPPLQCILHSVIKTRWEAVFERTSASHFWIRFQQKWQALYAILEFPLNFLFFTFV